MNDVKKRRFAIIAAFLLAILICLFTLPSCGDDLLGHRLRPRIAGNHRAVSVVAGNLAVGEFASVHIAVGLFAWIVWNRYRRKNEG